MKKSIVILLAGAFLLLSSCATKGDIDNLQSQIAELKSGQIATIESQISSINTSISTLQETERELKSYISALQSIAADVPAIKTAIEGLLERDRTLEKMIENLQSYVDTQLANARDWASATFATLDQYNRMVTEIERIKASIPTMAAIEVAYTQAINRAITSSENSLKGWVNEQLTGYWTIAETEAKLISMEGNLSKEDESIRGDIGKLRSSLDSTKTELTEGYKTAIKKAIEDNNGVFNGKLSEAVSDLNSRIDGEVSTINERIGRLEKRVLDLESSVSKLLSRIQSLSYIPRYTDGASTMWRKTTSDGSIQARDTLVFRVSPSDCADALVKVWEDAVSAEAVSLMTRSPQQTVTLPVVSVTGGNGKVSVVLDGSQLGEEFFNGEQQMGVVVIISDGNNERTSEYISMVAKSVNNVIYYTSNDGAIIQPHSFDFGATYVSNEYRNGVGIIMFNADVTSIGDSAFYGCSRLTSIQIPNSVTNIDRVAFHGCSRLTQIVIPDSVTNINESAFSGCSGLTSISIPNSVTSIGDHAFENCTGIELINLPNSITTIRNCTFCSCSRLNSIQIPNSVTSIGRDAFNDCKSLVSIHIPNSVTDIGDYAFSACFALSHITIPDSVTRIGEGAFYGCRSLTTIDIPKSLTSISDYAFRGCYALSSISIPESVTSIGSGAFQSCTKLKSILIPDSVLTIGSYTFSKSGLTSILLPNSVTSIGEGAFSDCTGLKSITSLSVAPYTIGILAFNNTSACPIYVPEESVDAYKAAEGWSVYADRIQANSYGKYDSNVIWTSSSNAYTQDAIVNGTSGVEILKLGTSSKAGEATLLLPKGTKSVCFYGVSWKGNEASVQVSLGETVLYTQTLAANEGATGNPTYTITVKDSDHYTMTFPQTLTEDMTVTVTTTPGGKTRIILFGIKAE